LQWNCTRKLCDWSWRLCFGRWE